MAILWIVIAIIVFIILWLIGTFNKLIVLGNRVKEAWSDINVQLKRRHDLIPNLVEIVKGYAAHEKEVFEKVTQARAQAMSAQGVQAKADAENMLSSTLKSLFAVAENYPELKASQNFLELQRDVRDTEDKIQASRRFYNGVARDLNITVESFPANIAAGMFGIKQAEFFQISEAEKEPVAIKF